MKTAITNEQIEKAAAKFPTNVAICEELGVNPNYINQRTKRDDEFRRAYERGKAKFSPSTKTKAEKPKEPPKEIVEEKELSAGDVKQLIFSAVDLHYCSKSSIRKKTGLENYADFDEVLSDMVIDGDLVKKIEKFPDIYVRPDWQIKNYWMHGKGKTNFEFFDEKLEKRTQAFRSYPQNGNRPKPEEPALETAQAEKPVELEASEPKPISKKTAKDNLQLADIWISKEARLVVGFDGNIFKMPRETREKLNDVIDVLQEAGNVVE